WDQISLEGDPPLQPAKANEAACMIDATTRATKRTKHQPPRQDSNLQQTWLRKPPLYPLSYAGKFSRTISSRNPASARAPGRTAARVRQVPRSCVHPACARSVEGLPESRTRTAG